MEPRPCAAAARVGKLRDPRIEAGSRVAMWPPSLFQSRLVRHPSALTRSCPGEPGTCRQSDPTP
jgi:hypothetical protein